MVDNQRNRLAFLVAVYKLVLMHPDGQISQFSLAGWIPDELYWRTTHRTSVDQLVDMIISADSVEETFSMLVSKLQNDWDKLRPELKEMIRDLIRQHRFRGNFEPYILRPSPEEMRDLSIRWDAAQVVFDAKRRRVVELLRNRGIDLGNRSAPEFYNLPTVQQCSLDLVPLLEARRDSDIAALQLCVPEHISSYMARVGSRCREVYFDFLEQIRTSAQEAHKKRFPNSTEDESGKPLEFYLEAFKERANKLIRSTSTSVEDGSILEEVRQFISSHQRPTKLNVYPEAFHMTKFENTGSGQQVVVTDHGHADHFSQHAHPSAPLNFDLVELAQELASLKMTAQQKAQTSEQLRSTADLADAEEAAKRGDRQGTLDKVNSAGKWAFEVAKDVGASVVAKIISAQMGLES